MSQENDPCRTVSKRAIFTAITVAVAMLSIFALATPAQAATESKIWMTAKGCVLVISDNR